MSNLIEIQDFESEVFEAYKHKYAIQHPPPVQEVAFSWKDLGFLYKLKLITMTFAVILAGFRTAEQFYEAASYTGIAWLGWMEAGSAVFAVEGTLIALAASKAKERGKISPFWTNVGLITAFFISLGAGIGQSFRINDFISEDFSAGITLVVSIALSSATIIAYIAGEIIGQELLTVELRNAEIQKSYSTDIQSWEKSLLSSWSRSPEKKQIKSQYGSVQNGVQNEHKMNTSEQKKPKGWKMDRAVEAADKLFWISNKEPTVRGLIDYLSKQGVNISVGTSQKALEKWRKN